MRDCTDFPIAIPSPLKQTHKDRNMEMDSRKLGAILATILAALFLAAPSPALAEEGPSDGTKYYLGSSANAGKDTGYSESNAIGKDDVHYSWELGQFLVSGYTRVVDDDGTPVFLKNVGDEVTLSFNLQQDIDQLNGNSDVTIDSDPNGYDQQLGVPQQEFGRGALIIQYTDYQNNHHTPTVYTDYLAGVSAGADTAVTTFEEGDYEVVLDYSIKNVNHGRLPWVNIEILPGVTDYTMRTRFKVRNGNCMVYPFDVKTGDELTNTAFTENGFKLDLARSRYLDIDVKKEMLADNGTELVPDTRFNKPARDGEEFTDEGVYTFTVTNRYTGQSTEKMIYVGNDPVLKAYVTTGKPVSDIQTLLADGAAVNEDGTIAQDGRTVVEAQPAAEDVQTPSAAEERESRASIVVPIATAVVVASLLAAVMVRRNKKKTVEAPDDSPSEE